LIPSCRVAAEHFITELVDQNAYGWLEVVSAPALIDVVRQDGAVAVDHGHDLVAAEQHCPQLVSLLSKRAGVEALCVAVPVEARHEVLDVKWTYHGFLL
jgi:hypothetical protein